MHLSEKRFPFLIPKPKGLRSLDSSHRSQGI
jgi:hypothetical protein